MVLDRLMASRSCCEAGMVSRWHRAVRPRVTRHQECRVLPSGQTVEGGITSDHKAEFARGVDAGLHCACWGKECVMGEARGRGVHPGGWVRSCTPVRVVWGCQCMGVPPGA